MLTSIRVVSTGASARCWSWTFMSSPVIVVCGILPEPAERFTVLVKVTGGKLCWRNTNTTLSDRLIDIVQLYYIMSMSIFQFTNILEYVCVLSIRCSHMCMHVCKYMSVPSVKNVYA